MTYDKRRKRKLRKAAMWRRRQVVGDRFMAGQSFGREGWYHAFGGEVADMAVDESGQLGPAWQSVVMGPSAFGPDSSGPDPKETEPVREKTFPGHNGAVLRWLGSWEHYPSVEEVDAVTPEQYRASEGARTEPIPDSPPELPAQRAVSPDDRPSDGG